MDISTLKDEYLVCCQCHKPYFFGKGERQFYLDKGLQLPRRCPECRAKRKAR
jgi:hypothetical protein